MTGEDTRSLGSRWGTAVIQRTRGGLSHLIQFAALPPQVGQTIRQVQRERLTYLSRSKLLALARLCLAAEKGGKPGCIVEAGCGLGGSAIVLCSAKQPTRELFLYDVFGMPPPPGTRDGPDAHDRYAVILRGESGGIGNDRYYGYVEDLYGTVQASFARLGYPIEANKVTPIQGLLGDTLRVTEQVCLAHVDVGWYESVMVCLTRIEPRLIAGGTIVIDDYDHWSGCRKAVDEYFKGKPTGSYKFDLSYGSLIVVKN
jgi:asparagine synthase (glutamine-hydrolysing)